MWLTMPVLWGSQRDVTAAALAAVDNRVADSMQRVAVLEAELRGIGKRKNNAPTGGDPGGGRPKLMTDEGRIQHYIDMAGGVPSSKPPIPKIPDGSWVITDRKSPHHRKTINMKALRGFCGLFRRSPALRLIISCSVVSKSVRRGRRERDRGIHPRFSADSQ